MRQKSKQTLTISVITVALNASGTIKDCLESVKNQSYPCEHIIIDGRSTDDTVNLARTYASGTAVIVSEPDKGTYDAMNKGLAMATGDVVGILNADDLYPRSDILARVAGALEDPVTDACYGDLVFVERTDTSKVKRRWTSCQCGPDFFYKGWMVPHPTLFIRRRIYERCGGFDLNLGSAADYELELRLFVKHGLRAIYIPEVMVVMRSGGWSNSSLLNRLRANRYDRMAWEVNGLKPRPWTTILKPLRKIHQFF